MFTTYTKLNARFVWAPSFSWKESNIATSRPTIWELIAQQKKNLKFFFIQMDCLNTLVTLQPICNGHSMPLQYYIVKTPVLGKVKRAVCSIWEMFALIFSSSFFDHTKNSWRHMQAVTIVEHSSLSILGVLFQPMRTQNIEYHFHSLFLMIQDIALLFKSAAAAVLFLKFKAILSSRRTSLRSFKIHTGHFTSRQQFNEKFSSQVVGCWW